MQIHKEIQSKLVVAKGWEKWRMGSDCQWVQDFFLSERNVLGLNSGDGCTTW